MDLVRGGEKSPKLAIYLATFIGNISALITIKFEYLATKSTKLEQEAQEKATEIAEGNKEL